MAFWNRLFNRKRLTHELTEADDRSLVESEEDPDEEPEEADPELNSEIQEEGSPAPADSDEEYEVVEREILPAKIICPDCGGITLEGLEFCDKCGGELQ